MMTRINRLVLISFIFILVFNIGLAQTVVNPKVETKKAAQQSIFAAAGTGPVTGSGTPGRLSKWAGTSGSNTFVLGDSNIFEDKFGKVGIGTSTPTSLLTVQGMIETTLGGYKFPDGTLQTTAAITSIFHDASLTGNGTQATPLGVAPGGINTIHLANGAVTGAKIAGGAVVRSLNGLFDNLQLAAGLNISITPSGNTLTIAAPNALSAVAHDTTLQGNGTPGSPLGVAAPLNLTGAIPFDFSGAAIIKATNTADGGFGVNAIGGNSNSGGGGFGVFASGGNSISSSGGQGVSAAGGLSTNGTGGSGVVASGGNSETGRGGVGLSAGGGFSNGLEGGVGVFASGGNSCCINPGTGGNGVIASGGFGNAVNNSGGDGIFAQAGLGFNGATNGRAGAFLGNVRIVGNLDVTGTKNFKIDHPLDPENKYLNHAAIESAEVLNVYSGNITTNANGEAIVTLPEWFEAVNRDLRYQLTVIGTFAQAIIAEKVRGNRFVIRTNASNVEVSWQVTGVRSDPGMRKNPFTVEEEKPERERGHYLNPEAFNQPEERSVEWVRHPEVMQQFKQQRLQAERAHKQQKQIDR